ncbi:glycine cleavage H-protein-domain-containing protein [Pavlovales sp. CCMP2436]|nr:glycine cleavage H-protein-domain-containing protein [Pavlovales sp. CCMP2436]
MSMALFARAARSATTARSFARAPIFSRGFAAVTKFTTDHEYVSNDNGIATVGITKFAAEALGDIVFVELPEVGSTIAQKEAMGVVESVKAASDVYMPISGEIVEVNEALKDAPATINEDPNGKGWMAKIKISDLSEMDAMMTAEAYKKFCDESH